MGYTHYWYRPLELPRERWTPFLGDWLKVYDKLVLRGLSLSDPDSPALPPVFHEGLVAFNGRPGWEPFLLSRRYERQDFVKPDGRCFSFCKTARRPYDLAVTACLLVAKRAFGSILTVSTDGEDADWQAARDLCQEVLGYGRDFRIASDDAGNRYALVERRAEARP
jgi:hypothetical protein